jgi:hypothetical protein
MTWVFFCIKLSFVEQLTDRFGGLAHDIDTDLRQTIENYGLEYNVTDGKIREPLLEYQIHPTYERCYNCIFYGHFILLYLYSRRRLLFYIISLAEACRPFFLFL